jgi:hypothetical protein
MNSSKYINNLINKLEAIKNDPIEKQVFVGFDGYIDKIQKAVKIRTKDEVEYYQTLTDFAQRIDMAAGKSGQVELVTQETKIGGNAPIMSNALGALGVTSVCLGNAGYPNRHIEYNNLDEKAEVLSIGEPAETNALEFNDGKMILSELSIFRKINWEYVKELIGLDIITDHLSKSSILALVGWCNPDHATDVWKGILNEVMPNYSGKDLIFFDLADPTKKNREDLLEVLEVINSFTKYGKVILGINENETNKLFDILSAEYPENVPEEVNLTIKGRFIYSVMNIEGLLVHPIDRCIMITNNDIIDLEGLIIEEPKISTGGGDNLNAGFCLGFLLGYSMEESMILGMATSGAYVKNGKSPDIPDLISYLNTWG